MFPYTEIDGSGALALSISLGVVPLISRLPGLLDVTGENYGFSFNSSDVESLASTMSSALLSNAYADDSGPMLHSFLEKFSWKKSIETVVDMYFKRGLE